MRPVVHGRDLDPHSRCAHWHGPLDIIAIRLRCCGDYWACAACHDELAGHPPEVWPAAEWDQPAVLCGACGVELTVNAYLGCDSCCPACAAPFNPGCRRHHHLYFECVESPGGGAAPSG